jgi:hypothetical protein
MTATCKTCGEEFGLGVGSRHKCTGLTFDRRPTPQQRNPEADQPTLRDQFAMAALTGIMASGSSWPNMNDMDEIALRSMCAADAMLEARKPKGGQ